MGDKATLAKARRELEDLYLGIPDESVNLTFEDLAEVKQQTTSINGTRTSSNKKITPPPPSVLQPIPKTSANKTPKHDSPSSPSPLHKLPSLDFSKVLRESNQNHHHHHLHQTHHDEGLHRHRLQHHEDYHGAGSGHAISPEKREEFRRAVDRSMAYDDASVMSMSMASGYPRETAQRRRPGIPHTNICTICTTYIYIFRHRCLVCGRVYCRDCVSIGMGEMTEGRKCIQCLGRRFSQRYIKRAGNVSCVSRYPRTVKQAELKWAEKGPRRSGERAFGGGGRSVMISRSRNPVNVPGTPTMAHASGHNTPSFVSASHYSPYISPGHHLPF